jgi:hypothetical protein
LVFITNGESCRYGRPEAAHAQGRKGDSDGPMKKFVLVLVAMLLLAVAAGLALLATWDIPAPTAPVEKTIPDDKFPR